MTKKLTKKQLKARSRKGREARIAKKEASLATIAREGCIKFIEAAGPNWETETPKMASFKSTFMGKVNTLRPQQRETVALMMDALFDTVLTKEEEGEISTLQEKTNLINSQQLTRAIS